MIDYKDLNDNFDKYKEMKNNNIKIKNLVGE